MHKVEKVEIPFHAVHRARGCGPWVAPSNSASERRAHDSGEQQRRPVARARKPAPRVRVDSFAKEMEMKDIANKFSATYDSVAGEISAATVSLLLHCAGRHTTQALCGVQSGSDEMMKLSELDYLDFH